MGDREGERKGIMIRSILYRCTSHSSNIKALKVTCNSKVTFCSYFDIGIGVGLGYSEEAHRSIKNFSPRQSYLRQRLVWWTRWTNNYWLELEFFGYHVFWSEGLRLPKKLDLQRAPLSKSVTILDAMSFFPFMLEFIHQRSLDHNVNLG
jgi:hypothetical protein